MYGFIRSLRKKPNTPNRAKAEDPLREKPKVIVILQEIIIRESALSLSNPSWRETPTRRIVRLDGFSGLSKSMDGRPSVVRRFQTFRDYWKAQPGQRGIKADWEATWRNCCRRETWFQKEAPLAKGEIRVEKMSPEQAAEAKDMPAASMNSSP